LELKADIGPTEHSVRLTPGRSAGKLRAGRFKPAKRQFQHAAAIVIAFCICRLGDPPAAPRLIFPRHRGRVYCQRRGRPRYPRPGLLHPSWPGSPCARASVILSFGKGWTVNPGPRQINRGVPMGSWPSSDRNQPALTLSSISIVRHTSGFPIAPL